MNKPIQFVRPDTCPKCGATHSVAAYNGNNIRVDMDYYIDNHKSMVNKQIYQVVCKKCGERFFPVWKHGLPYPNTDRDIDSFLNSYKLYKNVDP